MPVAVDRTRHVVVGVVSNILVAEKLVALVGTLCVSVELINELSGFWQFSEKMGTTDVVDEERYHVSLFLERVFRLLEGH